MDRGNTDYNQSGLNSSSATSASNSYPYSNPQAEPATSEQQSATYQQPTQEVRSAQSYPASATAPADYNINYQRTNFPQDSHRGYQEQRYPPTSNGPSAGMNQSASPLPPLAHGGLHRRPAHPESSEDPSITAATNPSYPPHPQTAYYNQPPPDMSQAYPQQPGGPPPQWRPDQWAQQGYPPPPQFSYGAHPGAPPVSAPPPAGAIPAPRTPVVDKARRKRHSNETATLSQVYSFIPIPGAQQHKRPRRRYEEIERMYKCGWQGCEKAYGTLNHLNAHVTMQAHGAKRTPEEFKEIRKEWKARKKEEENARKAQEEAERSRQSEQADQQPQQAAAASTAAYPNVPPRQLPPIAYQSQGVGAPVHYANAPTSGIELQGYAPTAPIYSTQPYPPSPYNHIPGQPYQGTRQQPANNEDDADAEADPDVPAGYNNQ
ncbi:hypothetical protein EV426DRAFT_631702 [Tirmania nivea]|nr:hypothetical protein EV426DRAFT_631702 [Tirmania nivea]